MQEITINKEMENNTIDLKLKRFIENIEKLEEKKRII